MRPSRAPILAALGAAASLLGAAPAHGFESSDTITERCDLLTRSVDGAYESTGQVLTPRFSYGAAIPTATTNGQFRVTVRQGSLDFSAADRAVLGVLGSQYSGGTLSRMDLLVEGGTPATLRIGAAGVPLTEGTLADEDGYTGIRFPASGSLPTSELVTREGSPSSYIQVRTGPVTFDTMLSRPGQTGTAVRIACIPAPLPDEANLLGVVGPSGSGGQPSRILSLSPSSGTTAGGTLVRAVYTNPQDSGGPRTATVGGRMDWGTGIIGRQGFTVTFRTPAGYAGAAPVRLADDTGRTVENGAADDFTYVAPDPGPAAAGLGRPTKAVCTVQVLAADGTSVDAPASLGAYVTIGGTVPATVSPAGQFSVSGARATLSFPFTAYTLPGYGTGLSATATRVNLGITGGTTLGIDAGGLPLALPGVDIPTSAEAGADPAGSFDLRFPAEGSLPIGPISPAGAAGSAVGVSWVGLAADLSFSGDGVGSPVFQRARAECFPARGQNGALASVRVSSPPPALPPLLTRATPNRGPVDGGGVAVISGVRLQGATSVRFGSVKARFFVSGQTLVAQIPAQKAPGIYPIIVTTPGGTSSGSTGLRYRYG